MFTDRWIDKQIVVDSYNGLLLSNQKNELLMYTTTWMNLKGITLSEKANPKGYVLCDSIYTTFCERKIIGPENGSVVSRYLE